MEKHSTLETSASVRNGVKRMIFVVISIVLEVILFVLAFVVLQEYISWIAIITRFVATILILLIYSQKKTASMKIPWIMIIMAVPIFGVVLYLMIGINGYTRWMAKRYQQVDKRLFPMLKEDTEAERALEETDPYRARLSSYLKNIPDTLSTKTQTSSTIPRQYRDWKPSLRTWQRQRSSFLWNTMP